MQLPLTSADPFGGHPWSYSKAALSARKAKGGWCYHHKKRPLGHWKMLGSPEVFISIALKGSRQVSPFCIAPMFSGSDKWLPTLPSHAGWYHKSQGRQHQGQPGLESGLLHDDSKSQQQQPAYHHICSAGMCTLWSKFRSNACLCSWKL